MSHTHTDVESSAGSSRTTSAQAEQTSNGHATGSQSLERADRVARALGWFSVGLGLTELLAPRQVGRFIGVGDDRHRRRTLQIIGLRELTSGAGILGQRRKTAWLWSRVAGDIIDLALLGWSLRSKKASRVRVPAVIASVIGVTALDVLTSRRLGQASRTGKSVAREPAPSVTRMVTVGRGPEELYQYWRNFQNLPTFMTHLQSVELVNDRRSRWKAEGPRDKSFEWEVEITEDRRGELIAWRTLDGAPLPSRGEVRFRRAPGGRGTEVAMVLTLEPPPAGKIGAAFGRALARVLKKLPEIQVENDLRRFKQVIEVGEVVCSDASVHRGPHPARPGREGER